MKDLSDNFSSWKIAIISSEVVSSFFSLNNWLRSLTDNLALALG